MKKGNTLLTETQVVPNQMGAHSEGISLLDKKLNIIHPTSAANTKNLFFATAGKPVNFKSLIHPDDVGEISLLLEEISRTSKQTKTANFRVRQSNGHFCWLKCTFSNQFHNEELNGIVCNFKEIAGQKDGEDLLQRSLQELAAYKYALDETAIVSITNQVGTITHVNDNFCSIAKYSREELQGKDHRILNSAYHPKAFMRNLWKTIATGKVWKEELKNKAKDGSYYWVDTTIIPFYNAKGDPYQYVSLATDITERKLIEEQVKLAELEILNKNVQIENLLENITDGFIALDENRCYTYANQEIGKMLNVDPETLIGKNIWHLFPEVVGSPTYNAIELALTKRKYIINEDYYAPLNLWQENRIYPSGNGVAMFIRNVTHRKTKEIEKSILATIHEVFNLELTEQETLSRILEQIAVFGNFSVVEAWLIDPEEKKIRQAAKYAKGPSREMFDPENARKSIFTKGQGLPGLIWELGKTHYWQDIDDDERFIGHMGAKNANLKAAYGVPIWYHRKVIGALIIGLPTAKKYAGTFTDSLNNIGTQLGAEIMRRHLEFELNQLFSFTPDVLCTLNVEGYFTKVNPAMCQLLEYSEKELMSKPYHHFLHPDDKQASSIELDNIINGNPTYYIENRYITKSGQTKVLAWTTTKVSDQGVIYCSAKDVTDRQELQELLDKATRLARIGGWEINLENDTVHWSDITKEIHETEKDFVPDLNSIISFYKKGHNRDRFKLKLQEVMEKGVICDDEFQIVTAKGKLKWVRVIAEAKFLNHKCIKVQGSFQDINTLKQTELIAKKVLEERNTILESIRDAFFAVDKNWTVTYWNSTAEYIMHKTKEEVLHKNLWQVLPEAVNSLSYQKYHEAIATNQAVHFEDHYLALAKWYEISAYPSEVGLSVYFKDITERKISELLLNDLNISLHKQAKELADSNAELEQFAYVASHDLQEPLRMVTSFLTQLESKYNDVLDDKGKKYIYFAVDGAKRMRQIILDLLEFSRVGKLAATVEEVNIEEVVNDILILYRTRVREQKATISFTNLPSIYSYRAPIRQLFQNLISNALKYTHPERAPQITIACKETDKAYTFSVKDNGIGVSSEYFEKIFIIFQRLHNREAYSGTGIGLAIAKKIVENMGGKIWLESKEDEGSTFYFSVPKN